MDLPGGFHTGEMEFLVGPQGWPVKAYRATFPNKDSPGSTVSLAQACLHGPLRLSTLMVRAVPISLFEVVPTMPQSQNRECTFVVDPEGYEWLIHAESGGRLMRIGLIPVKPDPKRAPTQPLIPAGYCRIVAWNVQLMPANKSRNRQPIRPMTSDKGQTVFVNHEYCYGPEDNSRVQQRPSEQSLYPYDEDEEAILVGELAMNVPMDEVYLMEKFCPLAV
ncbi:hypothetical protein Ciccas_012965 [Cichlidogyrus casuarinus]|uniref:Uncharacterized protein n=1 Tax=Cichlidogyrus casuarinus TaxID=1844966 RepID=A0ABD2PN69_9PLAT